MEMRCALGGDFLSLALRFPITNTHTHNFYFHARTPVSLSPELLLLCVASIIRIPYSIYTPAAGGAALDKIRRTHRKNKIASQPEEKLHYTHFILRPYIWVLLLLLFGKCCRAAAGNMTTYAV
jgi:hypothetical protein